MKYHGRPVRTTILYGFICAGLFLAVQMLGRFMIFWPAEKYLLAWFVMSGYGLLLARWAKRNPIRIFIPYLLFLIIFFLARSEMVMVLASLVILGWVRSWICFKIGWVKGVFAEMFIGFGAMLLVFYLAPGTVLSQAMGILIFFMIQAGYFTILTESCEPEIENRRKGDPFDKARKQAESILAPEPF